MSYQTWTNNGFGVKLDLNPTEESLRAFLHLAPETEESVFDWVKNEEEEDPEKGILNFILDNYESSYSCALGLAGIIEDVFSEITTIPFTVCDDYEGNYYLLYIPDYPWELSETEKTLTREQVEETIGMLSMLDPEFNQKPDFHSVENGG